MPKEEIFILPLMKQSLQPFSWGISKLSLLEEANNGWARTEIESETRVNWAEVMC